METTHQIIYGDSRSYSFFKDNLQGRKANLIITSPPYPMVEMWDDMFRKQSGAIDMTFNHLENDIVIAFELMHKELDKVWTNCKHNIAKGGIVCINIGDATRTFNKKFQLFPNHARIIHAMTDLGFEYLPSIIWNKLTNSPNKFMGSGMLPGGAYITMEHEHILVFRYNGNREFKKEDKPNRRESAYFWEERNDWFTNMWNIHGTRQTISDETSERNRNAAFPLEIPYRLINMFSVRGDLVVDPYGGLGTTTLGAMMLGRDSISFEIDKSLRNSQLQCITENISELHSLIEHRLNAHQTFVDVRTSTLNKKLKHFNENIGMHVMTKQETDILFYDIENISTENTNEQLKFNVSYKPFER